MENQPAFESFVLFQRKISVNNKFVIYDQRHNLFKKLQQQNKNDDKIKKLWLF